MLQTKIQIKFQVETNTNIDNIMTNTKFGLFDIASTSAPPRHHQALITKSKTAEHFLVQQISAITILLCNSSTCWNKIIKDAWKGQFLLLQHS